MGKNGPTYQERKKQIELNYKPITGDGWHTNQRHAVVIKIPNDDELICQELLDYCAYRARVNAWAEPTIKYLAKFRAVENGPPVATYCGVLVLRRGAFAYLKDVESPRTIAMFKSLRGDDDLESGCQDWRDVVQ